MALLQKSAWKGDVSAKLCRDPLSVSLVTSKLSMRSKFLLPPLIGVNLFNGDSATFNISKYTFWYYLTYIYSLIRWILIGDNSVSHCSTSNLFLAVGDGGRGPSAISRRCLSVCLKLTNLPLSGYFPPRRSIAILIHCGEWRPGPSIAPSPD